MVRLPIQPHDLLHLFSLCCFPDACWEAVRAGHDQHTAFDLEDVAMPELAFVGVKGFEESRTDHVFDANEASIGGRGVVDEALADVWPRRNMVS